MGAGRKTRTLALKEKPHPSWTVNCSVTARNLRKSDLGGVIFGCKHKTFQECISKQLFGLPDPHFAYVKNITPGVTLFLFNYSDRKLHGLFEAAGPGQLNINPYGWTGDGAERTPYAAQVRVCVRKQCRPLLEDQFAPIIADNYYEQKLFWFELDREQTRKLEHLFLSSLPPPNAPRLENTARWSNIFLSPSCTREQTDNGKDRLQKATYCVDYINEHRDLQEASCFRPDVNSKTDPEWSHASVMTNMSHTAEERTWSSLLKNSEACDTEENDTTLEMQGMDLKLPRSDQSMLESESSGVSPCEVEDGQLFGSWEDQSRSGGKEEPSNSSCCISTAMPIEMCQPSQSSIDNNIKERNYDSGSTFMISREHPETYAANHFREADVSSEETYLMHTENKFETGSLDLQTVVAKLVEEIDLLKGSQLTQNLKINSLEQELIESKLQIEELKNKESVLASGPSSSNSGRLQEVSFELLHKPPCEVDDSVLVIGGFDGSSWLPTMNSFSLSYDRMKTLSPLTFIRSFPAVTKMNGELFIIGGKHGDVWYDTVESYSLARNQWVSLPSLNKKKGSSAGASLFGKIFSCGGGNGVECFSEVEMFDWNSGRWMFSQSMHQKRFSPAASEIDGVLYIVGGYDGRSYLNSVERFDPREHAWTRMRSMSAKRGCHSLVTLNEKLYAIGGHDGSGMVSTVEVLDPRVGSWMTAEPMNDPRGYAGAVVINQKIYIIGGVNSGGKILDTTECYEEGRGWQTTNLKALGSRCCFSAIVM